MSLDISKITPVYQYWITELIEKMGKRVVLVKEVQPDTQEDEKLSDWERSLTESTRVETEIKALVNYNSRNFMEYTGGIKQPKGVLELKTYLSNTPVLLQCDWIIPSADSRGYIDARYKLARDPIPVGLGQDAFVVTYWERV